MPAFRSSSSRPLSNNRTSPEAKSAVNPTRNSLDIVHLSGRGCTERFGHCTNRTHQQATVGAYADHFKTLFHSHSSVLSAGRHDPARESRRANPFLYSQNLFSNSRSFPLTGITGRCRKISRAEK